ncbi:MAG: hypothetical protein A3C90_00105 [Candidatus Magasanikbacteria bacterium RIFCSPHIGHO2_02_FULL_51_14]|uniref:BF1531-like N-terminal domain-containing protein n=1 Tax=Candidatus Magasanikbacteria bacterium RIFCSPHIGHO2_02_FULL_51_14 TaxID=1798683 RepID=A0A1F6MCX4_9BACT|nr:MAG: hypothetical protein A3C90_00105 [Candidatus Magasanikbacteria bacterium RIFCSPHIGHO2_02_FULL_51_14]
MNKRPSTTREATPATVADYVSAFKQGLSEHTADTANVRIAVLTSFTVKGIKEILSVQCWRAGMTPDIYLGEYNQYSQEIANEKSGLYAHAPDVVILFIDARTLLGDYAFDPYAMTDDERRAWVEEQVKRFCLLIGTLKQRLPAKIIFHNLEVPTYSPLGISEQTRPFGYIESIETLNSRLRDAYKTDTRVRMFDYNAFASSVGKSRMVDHTMYYLADMRVALQLLPLLCEAYMGYIKPAMSATKKCIVLDLDNTLWGGVIGEDGMAGIRLGPTPEGRSFWEFQKALLALQRRGVILAVNSKNNAAEAMGVIRQHPYMVLQEEHFAAFQINWDDKATNMRRLADELNIGIDSFVFFDDDAAQRELVRQALPEISVVSVPDDASLYVTTLREIHDFHAFQITEEDAQKGRMYSEQRKRNELQKNTLNMDDYLKQLRINVELLRADSFTIPRIVQLTQKTNQFNLTTRRYTEEDIRAFLNRGALVVAIRVTDMFGDNGITGVAIVETGSDLWRIDTFLLSCRIIGRKVEEALLGYILDTAKQAGIRRVVGEFLPTPKNAPSENFYRQNNFELRGTRDDMQLWEYDTQKPYQYPAYIHAIFPDV